MNANEVKKELRANGIKTKNIRIRCNYSAVYITLKDLTIDIDKVQEVARNKWEHYSRDERSGEILQGGNTFVFVEYDWQVLRDAAAERMDEAEKIINDGECVTIATNEETQTSAVLMFVAPESTQNAVVIRKAGEACSSYELGRHAAYNAHAVAAALVLFAARGRF
jgi:hypothetical protein